MDVNIGKGITLAIDTTLIVGPVLDHVMKIGLRNILMDCHAGITKADHPTDYTALSKAKAEAKLAAMIAGDIRAARATSGITRDPVRAEALKMARKAVNAVFRKPKDKDWVVVDKTQWIDVKTSMTDYDFDTEAGIQEAWDALVEAQADACMDDAEKIVALRSAPKAAVSLAGLTHKA